ncbi:MAG: biotin carboxyl carrier protein [Acidobacteria bacterium]|nr:biotin carboxyl carrier protein [Acidobacteriota bacterium]
MNIKEVKDLIHEVLQSDISEFELEHTGTRVKLRRGLHRDSAAISSLPAPPAGSGVSIPNATVSEQGAPQAEFSEAADEDSALHIITSPIVGTFYRAPSPGAEFYVKPGDQVHEGSILCIVEAMKLMNEIPSDIEGEVVRICVENGSPVEFGQKLFAIRPNRQG